MAQTYDISLGSDSVLIDGTVPLTELIAIQVVGSGLDSTVNLSLQQSDDRTNWHDLPEVAISNLNISSLLQTKSFYSKYLAVKVDVLSATVGTLTIYTPNI